jgi:hypothetical protein
MPGRQLFRLRFFNTPGLPPQEALWRYPPQSHIDCNKYLSFLPSFSSYCHKKPPIAPRPGAAAFSVEKLTENKGPGYVMQ